MVCERNEDGSAEIQGFTAAEKSRSACVAQSHLFHSYATADARCNFFYSVFLNTFQTRALIRCSHAKTWHSGLQRSLATQHSAPQQDSDDEHQSAPQSSTTCMQFAHQTLYNGCGQISTADAEQGGSPKFCTKKITTADSTVWGYITDVLLY